jgi:hypothetical protein
MDNNAFVKFFGCIAGRLAQEIPHPKLQALKTPNHELQIAAQQFF